MKEYRYICGGFLLAILLVWALSRPIQARPYPASYKVSSETKQLIVVRYKKNSKGTLTYYSRDGKGDFKKVYSCTAYLGRKGIGKKKEGDKKSPKGLYSLDQAFGICSNPGTKMPYVKINGKHYWCDESGSPYYNCLIRTDQMKHVCRGEHLSSYKGFYDYALSIGYNKERKAGKGSAIFLHCSKGKYTSGCIAIPKKYMKKILRKLDAKAKPMILIY